MSLSSLQARCGFAALIGASNAGKSTLMNAMAGTKLSIVTPKVQTTRFRVIGIIIHRNTQILLVDTPGIFKPKRLLDRAMVSSAWSGTNHADIIIFLVDVRTGLTTQVEHIIERLKNNPRHVWLVLNKIDLVPRDKLLPLAAQFNKLLKVEKTFMISAHKKDGIKKILDSLAQSLPEGPYLYPEDELTNLPNQLLVTELIREKIFFQTKEEVPYSATVEVESWKDQFDGSLRINAVIYVTRKGQKAILIGEKGNKIKIIGEKSRKEISRLLGKPCHLFLTVKQRAGWDEDRDRLRALGLDDV